MAITLDDLTQCQKLWSMWYIAVCENGGDPSALNDMSWAADNYYNNVNYGDPFTLGIMQWASGAACALLLEMQKYDDLWQALPETYRTDVANHGDPEGDYRWWGNRTMTKSEHETYQQAVKDHLSDAKNAQYNMWFNGTASESLSGYISGMANLGITPSNIKNFMYYMGLYHFAPAYCQETWQLAGDSDLTTIADNAMGVIRQDRNYNIYGQGWSNRYSRTGYATTLVQNWDGESCPDDWGSDFGTQNIPQAPNGTTVTDGANNSEDPNTQIIYVDTNNQDLCIHFASGAKLLCRQAQANNVWIPYTRGKVANPDTNATTPDTDRGDSSQSSQAPTGGWPHTQEAIDMIEPILGTWTYMQGSYEDKTGHFSDPWKSATSDCSGLVWWTYYKLDPDTANKMGAYANTTTMQKTCYWLDLSGGPNDRPDESKMLPGDIILCNYNTYDSYMAGGHSGSHVGLYVGNDTVYEMLPNTGPTKTTIDGFISGTLYWEVRRPPYSS